MRIRPFSSYFLARSKLNGISAGLALAPWNVLAGGRIRTDEEEERRRQTGENGRTMSRPDWERTEPERKLCKALEEVQKQVGAKSIQAGTLEPNPSPGCAARESRDRSYASADSLL